MMFHFFEKIYFFQPASTKHVYNIYTTTAQRRRRLADVVYCCTNVLSLLGEDSSVLLR